MEHLFDGWRSGLGLSYLWRAEPEFPCRWLEKDRVAAALVCGVSERLVMEALRDGIGSVSSVSYPDQSTRLGGSSFAMRRGCSVCRKAGWRRSCGGDDEARSCGVAAAILRSMTASSRLAERRRWLVSRCIVRRSAVLRVTGADTGAIGKAT